MKHGLSEDIWEQFSQVFSRYPAIRGVFLYGSRAKGRFRDNSDIDLAVDAPAMSDQEFSQLWNEIDALPIVFKIDPLTFKVQTPATFTLNRLSTAFLISSLVASVATLKTN